MNTKRMNRLEELGRVDAEKADTRKGKRNLREEKSRIVRELKAKGGMTRRKRKKMGPDSPDTPRKGRGPGARNRKIGKFPDLIIYSGVKPKVTRGNFKSGGRAKRGGGCEIR